MYEPDSYEELMMAAMAGNGCTSCLATTHTEDNCPWEKQAQQSLDAAAKRAGSKHEETPIGVNVYCATCGWLFPENADPEWHPEVFW